MLYDYLYREIFSNRRLLWFVVIASVFALGLLAYMQNVFTEMDELSSADQVVLRHEHADIKVIRPRPRQVITSPFVIRGEARGSWFFEGDFVIELIDEGGEVIRVVIAHAEGDWMTDDFVQFTAYLDFEVFQKKDAELIFIKDNPTGLPEDAIEIHIPVLLNPA
jgi:hypothetical protein